MSRITNHPNFHAVLFSTIVCSSIYECYKIPKDEECLGSCKHPRLESCTLKIYGLELNFDFNKNVIEFVADVEERVNNLILVEGYYGKDEGYQPNFTLEESKSFYAPLYYMRLRGGLVQCLRNGENIKLYNDNEGLFNEMIGCFTRRVCRFINRGCKEQF